MSKDNESQLQKSTVEPYTEGFILTHDNPELARRAKSPRVISRTSKHKGLPSNQLSLFDDEGASA